MPGPAALTGAGEPGAAVALPGSLAVLAVLAVLAAAVPAFSDEQPASRSAPVTSAAAPPLGIHLSMPPVCLLIARPGPPPGAGRCPAGALLAPPVAGGSAGTVARTFGWCRISWGGDVTGSSVELIVPVHSLFTKYDGFVRTARWTDAALAAAGMWQAADDALGNASTPLAKVAASARSRPGLVGRSAARVLDAALGLRARPARQVRAGEPGVDEWRATLIEVALRTAALAMGGDRPDAGTGAAPEISSLVGALGPPPPGLRGL